eukprot:8148802-Pyramimonas_sp.AAC.1
MRPDVLAIPSTTYYGGGVISAMTSPLADRAIVAGLPRAPHRPIDMSRACGETSKRCCAILTGYTPWELDLGASIGPL